ncbi:MAG: xanthine dehydrogenase family protein molybdopterin-binding subunit [Pseudomonadales bacterium]|nr:xanthine dehydrogenase family protein molybdopterin-binding subunit [Pseudomonadales bacterium]
MSGQTSSEYKYIGTRSIRPDGADKVTGRANYGADFFLPGMVHGKILRSPLAHAKILSIDVSAALAMPGVLSIATSEDLPDMNAGTESAGEGEVDFYDFSCNVLAREKVLYHGQAVAAVAATSEAIARSALDKIVVDYEELTPVLDLLGAQKSDSPLLHKNQTTEGPKGKGKTPSNIAKQMMLARGNVDEGFSEADVVVEKTFISPIVHQGYIEPHACVVRTNESNQIDVWCSSQGHFMVRSFMARLLAMDVSNIKVTPLEIGGGFGGKTVIYLEPVAAILSRKAGRPVKMVMDREEVFRATGPGSSSIVKVKVGAKSDGRIVAMEADITLNAGAFKGSPMMPSMMCVFTPYTCPNMKVTGKDVVTNTPKVAAYRAPGAPQSHLAAECVVNEIAKRLNIDPIDLRLLNAVDEGSPTIYGPKFKAIGLKAALTEARSHPHYASALSDNQGRGVACGFWFNVGLQSSATINITESGKAVVITGNPDIGGSRASMALMAAESLGIPLDQIKPIIGDTESVGYNDVTGGSRTTFASGGAVIKAAENLIQDLKRRAAKLMDIDVELVQWIDGQAVAPADLDKKPLSLARLARKAGATGGPLTATATQTARGAGPSFAVNIIDVEVDKETGSVDVKRVTVLQDAGKAIHPSYVEGQMQGGAVQGIGWALNEEFVYNEKGVMENPGFLDYRIPLASDLPMIDTVIIEVPNPGHPYGVRGVGEAPICPPMAAVTSAVNDAIGCGADFQLTELPLSPVKVLDAAEKLMG